MAQLIMAEGATPATPSSGKATLFINTSGKLCVRDDAGNVFVLASLSEAQTITGDLTVNRLIIGAGATLTIASGIVTITHSMHTIDTQSAAATDDLDTINGGVANQILILRTASSDRDVVLRHGVGNILTATGSNITLGASTVRFLFMYDGSNWREIGSWAS